MRQFSRPTATEQIDYLLRLYFGADPDRLTSCVDRAYRDMNRTLHGFAREVNSDGFRTRASAVVRSFLASLAVSRGDLDQTGFDEGHRIACTKLCATYSETKFSKFRVGQAQKWLSMALKYVFVFGESRLPGYATVFDLAYIPLDNIILDELRPYGVPRLGTRWSRVDSYDEYMKIQQWGRAKFTGSAPLAVECALWQNAGGSGTSPRH